MLVSSCSISAEYTRIFKCPDR